MNYQNKAVLSSSFVKIDFIKVTNESVNYIKDFRVYQICQPELTKCFKIPYGTDWCS
ncbi:protein of unknown function [Vibrio tapetis subsp. tapetis]|uniref:Uncharacterized protein n=1 Tax=Vibrio tapetis subsp. tapetis TaxID=1671868 RepID=A0A2N8ZJR6_9VIBR|nr:protein of unknown function [Vibrio tapetis subsp. tapetis]